MIIPCASLFIQCDFWCTVALLCLMVPTAGTVCENGSSKSPRTRSRDLSYFTWSSVVRIWHEFRSGLLTMSYLIGWDLKDGNFIDRGLAGSDLTVWVWPFPANPSPFPVSSLFWTSRRSTAMHILILLSGGSVPDGDVVVESGSEAGQLSLRTRLRVRNATGSAVIRRLLSWYRRSGLDGKDSLFPCTVLVIPLGAVISGVVEGMTDYRLGSGS